MAAQGKEMKLLGSHKSPFSLRVEIAFNLKGLGYELLEETWEKSQLLLESNPIYKMIPVLIHDGQPICESMMIVEYIDEVWARTNTSILPSDPYDRAMARFWAKYIDDKVPPSLRIIMGLLPGSEEEAVNQILTALQLLEKAFEKCGEGNDFFGGETVGYVDIALGCYLGWFKAMEKMNGFTILDESKTPLLVGWANRFCSHDSVKGVMPEVEMLIEFNKKVRDKLNVAPAN
ncbi:glutathione S-transferase U17-like [Typha angustifolia]|uniref:glutathione S-transferase U17-like n=1 Tax=Typha angustifolia TaxID=59011 RepID=UPI003C2BD463